MAVAVVKATAEAEAAAVAVAVAEAEAAAVAVAEAEAAVEAEAATASPRISPKPPALSSTLCLITSVLKWPPHVSHVQGSGQPDSTRDMLQHTKPAHTVAAAAAAAPGLGQLLSVCLHPSTASFATLRLPSLLLLLPAAVAMILLALP